MWFFQASLNYYRYTTNLTELIKKYDQRSILDEVSSKKTAISLLCQEDQRIPVGNLA